MRYRADIDGLRAVAVLLVLVYHLNAGLVPGGFVGVDVFFVISGFVVTGSLTAPRTRSFWQYIGEFYARRLVRIVPALVFVLLATCVLASLFIPRSWASDLNDRTLVAALFGLSNVVLMRNTETYFAPRAELNPYLHTWSLGVEEQFYLVFPCVVFLGLHAVSRGARRAGLAILLGTVTISFAAAVWMTRLQPQWAFYAMPVRFWELGVGALLCMASQRHQERPADRQRSALMVSPGRFLGLLLIATAGWLTDRASFPIPWAIAAVAGAALLIGVHQPEPSKAPTSWLRQPVMVWIGQRSYSLYLWHWPVFVLFRWTMGLDDFAHRVLAALLTFAAATCSYSFVERPIRESPLLRQRHTLVRIGAMVALVAAGWKTVDALLWRHDRLSLSVVARNAGDWYPEGSLPVDRGASRRCQVMSRVVDLSGGRQFDFQPTSCIGAQPPPRPALFVFGDSHAGAYAPMLWAFAAETGRPVHIYTRTGCAFLDLRTPMRNTPDECRGFFRTATETALGLAASGDVAFLPSLRQARFIDQFVSDQTADADDVASPLDMPDVRAWLQPFRERGVIVLFEAPKPLFRSPPFRCADWFNAGNDVCRGGLTQPRAFLEERRLPILASMQALASDDPGVHVWDPFPLLCPEDPCSAVRNDRPLFFDADHISRFGNAVLFESFASAVTRIAPDAKAAAR